jgi:hypothetical protein
VTSLGWHSVEPACQQYEYKYRYDDHRDVFHVYLANDLWITRREELVLSSIKIQFGTLGNGLNHDVTRFGVYSYECQNYYAFKRTEYTENKILMWLANLACFLTG